MRISNRVATVIEVYSAFQLEEKKFNNSVKKTA